LQGDLAYAAFGKSKIKVIIIDEAHGLSKAAFTAMLKTIEEPPAHVYFMFCTTDSEKVPDNIKTRCNIFTLTDVAADDIFDLLSVVNDEEQLGVSEKGLNLISTSCYGSPRRALTMLSKCIGLDDIKDIRKILQEPDTEEGEVIELCRGLIKGMSFLDALAIVKKLNGVDPESVRLVVLSYTSKVLLGSKTQSQAEKLLAILEAFSKPFYKSEKLAPLLLALGGLLI